MSHVSITPDPDRDPATMDFPPKIKPGALDRYTDTALDARMDEMIAVKMDLRRGDVEKLQAWMHSDQYEKAQALRHADLTECAKSLEFLVNEVLRHPSGGTERAAAFLASLYNGHRVKCDLSGIFALDSSFFEHTLNVMRLCFETHREPHSFFANGNEIFERIIKQYGLEKRRRKS